MVNAAISAPVYHPAQTSPSSVRDLAAAGHFRALALWLNEPLAAQGIYVQVQAEQPGRLLLLVEFEQPPLKERLTRFLCHRVWLLNSPLIEGIHVIARPAGRRRILWQQRVRIVTPALRDRGQTQSSQSPVSPKGSPLPPRLRSHPAAPAAAQTANRPILLMGSHLKTLRALVLTGSAVAAFIFGCLVEVILTGPSPVLPSFTQRPEVQQTADAGYSSGFTAPPTSTVEPPVATPVRYEVRGNPTTGVAPEMRSPIVDAALEPVAVIQHPPVAPAAPDVTLLFGGDISLEDISYNEAGEAEQLFAGLDEYQQADLAMINLASSLASAATSLNEEFHHRSRPDAIDLLKQGGVDVINLASEGTMEFGGEGLAETLENLDRQGLYRVGAGRNELEARRPEIIDIKGKRIAYLSYAQGGDNAAHGDRPGINAQGVPGIAQDIRALRDQVDWIVVNYRWQTDIPEAPADWQTNLARLAVDQGADLVVGYHPRTLQGAEIYKGSPIAYSLGDFIFQKPTAEPDAADAELPQSGSAQDTAVLKVSLKENQMRVEFVPVQVKNSRPELATGRKGTEILKRIEQSSAGFERPMRSSAVLELKGKEPIVDQPVSPETPFVSPQPVEVSPVEPLPREPQMESLPGELQMDEGFQEQAPKSSPEPSLPVDAVDVEAAPDLPVITEEGLTEEGLNDWGPKSGPNESQFMPIPQAAPGSAVDGGREPLQPLPSSLSSPNDLEPEVWLSPEIRSENSAVEAEELPLEGVPAIDGPALTPETSPRPKGIRPFGEPLVGPLGSTEAQPKAVAVTPAGLGSAKAKNTSPLPVATPDDLPAAEPLNESLNESPSEALTGEAQP
ncbi:MAG: CapA family protein [Cyanobacteria bacterium Co-bin13]|nr:CapA family protein [Cyanobacteria bacterium Co-bin13]